MSDVGLEHWFITQFPVAAPPLAEYSPKSLPEPSKNEPPAQDKSREKPRGEICPNRL